MAVNLIWFIPLKWCNICQSNAFLGWAAELSMWIGGSSPPMISLKKHDILAIEPCLYERSKHSHNSLAPLLHNLGHKLPFFNKHSLQVSQCGWVGHSDMNRTPRLIPQVFKRSSLQAGHAILPTRKYTSLNIMFLCIIRLECTCCWHQRKQVWPLIIASLMRLNTGYEQMVLDCLCPKLSAKSCLWFISDGLRKMVSFSWVAHFAALSLI